MKDSTCLFALVSLLIGGLEYSDPRTLNGPFLLDDQGTIKFHSYVWETNATFTKLWTTDFWGTELASAVSHKSWRPLVTWTFRMQSGQTGAPPTEPFWYHVGNVCLHAANSLLAYLCARNFFPLFEKERLAFMTALFFAAHPIHTEAVSNITGRAEGMCSFFFMLGFVLYAAGGSSPSKRRDFFTIFAVLLCTFLSLVSKEQGILLPAICIAWDLLMHSLFHDTGTIRMQFLLKAGALAASTAVLGVWRLSLNGEHPPDLLCIQNPASCEPALLTRFLSFSYLYVVNVYFLLLPLWSAPDWSGDEFPVITSLAHWKVPSIVLFYLSFATVALQGVMCAVFPPLSHPRLLGHHLPHFRVVACCLCWAAGTFLFNSNVLVYVGFVFNERGLYLPSLGYCALLAFALDRLCAWVIRSSSNNAVDAQTDAQQARRIGHQSTWLWMCVSGVILALYTQRLQYQNHLWSDGLVLWRNAHDTAPKATLSTGELSLMLVERKMYHEAIPFLENTWKHLPHLFEKAFLLSLAYQTTGRCNMSMQVLQRSKEAVESEHRKKVRALRENRDVPLRGIYYSNREDWQNAKLAQLESGLRSARSFLAIAESRCLSILSEAGLMALKAVEYNPSKEAIGHAQNLDARVSQLLRLKLDPRRVVTWYEDDGVEHFAYDAEDMKVVALIKQNHGVFPRHLMTAADRKRLGVDKLPGDTPESREKNVQVFVKSAQQRV